MIDRFPQVGAILEDYGSGCLPCSVGPCLLSDIVEIHNLSTEYEEALMMRIASVVAPGRTVRLPEARKYRSGKPRNVTGSPPLKRVVGEHKLIKRFIALVPAIAGRL